MKFVEILLLQCGEVLGGLTVDELGCGIEARFESVMEERALPSGVRGPVDLRALSRLASI